MITATIVAVALGLTPVDANNPAQLITNDYQGAVGRYSEQISPKGVVHVRGSDPRTGAPYELTIDRAGYVIATVGDQEVRFRARPAN
ncbi:hypothetical protein [Sphingomonas sp.]|uniref:hypothetical protein n=1 Tax=Sphingomonas sp. TaxID=28214 RepID=UPI0025D1354F|nr:hypothetical protein [Sphingomonas sp.]MBV9528001.1 hypothetical protein [Sphingomonas sp.]